MDSIPYANWSATRRLGLKKSSIPGALAVIVVPLSQTIRNIPVEVPLGHTDVVPRNSVANADTITTVPKTLLLEYLTTLSSLKVRALDDAIRFALDLS